MKNKNRWLLCSILFGLFIILTVLATFNKTGSFDMWFYHNFVTLNDVCTPFMKFITAFANTKTLVIVCVLSLVTLFAKKYWSIFLVDMMITSTLITQVLKFLIARSRPGIGFHLVYAVGFSYPSGHTVAAVTFYGSLMWLIGKSTLNKLYKWIINSILCSLVLSIGYSRIYLGVHYFTDVLGGILLGLCLLLIGTYFYEKYGKVFFK